MKNHFLLKPFVGQLATLLLPAAVMRHSFFINDVAPDLEVTTDPVLLASAVNRLLQTAVQQTNYNCIRITASVEQEQLRLQVQDEALLHYL